MPSISVKYEFAAPESGKSGLPDAQQLAMLHYAKQRLLKKIAYIDEQIANVTARMENVSDLNNPTV